MNKAVFIDKDGTLIRNVPYNINTDLISFVPDAVASLKMLQECDYQLILVSNQPGVALGYFSEEELHEVFEYLEYRLQLQGVQLDGYYYCPHDIEGVRAPYVKACYCRKPMPGMLLAAAMDRDIDLERSWMIGDILNDTEAGNRAGCKTILLNNGNETEWELTVNRRPLHICRNWKDAAGIIVQYAKETARVEHL